MKVIAIIFLFFTATLYADKAPFAAQSDVVADLSDSILDGIYRHPLPFCELSCEKSVWLESFGSYRKRDKTSERNEYSNGLGGLLGGFNYAVSCRSALNFFVGGSWGNNGIRSETSFDTDSILFGMALEKLCTNRFFGAAIVVGVLRQERSFLDVREKAEGVFFTPEITYACRFAFCNLCPISTSTLRYAGFFPGDYQHREIFGTLYVKNRSIQLFTLREELAIPFCRSCFFPYLGVAGRFQFSGRRVESHLLLDDLDFSNGIHNSIGYGFVGLRGLKQCGCLRMQANLEGSYDTDKSWRVLGELTCNYAY